MNDHPAERPEDQEISDCRMTDAQEATRGVHVSAPFPTPGTGLDRHLSSDPDSAGGSPVSPLRSSDHHGTHRHLLLAPDAPVDQAATIDAIVVPTVRHRRRLLHAADLSRRLRCPLLVICSGPYTGTEHVKALGSHGAEVIAIDFTHSHALALPRFETSSVLPHRFRRRTDTAAKRNLALALARMRGWRRIVFLDDDIEVSAPDDLRRAAGLLHTYSAVGLSVGGFPDNSVVCHAFRAVGGAQDSFVGGGALAVETTRCVSYFPDIYNEDWFYLLEADGLRPLAVTGTVKQAPYEPFRTPARARNEELGDVLAEGIFWLLDEGRTIRDAHQGHWKDFLARRHRFILSVLRHIPDSNVESGERRRMEEALKASLGRLALITPDMCLTYLDAWRADLKSWRDFVECLPVAESVGEALRRLSAPTHPPFTSIHLRP
ncbi:hypothetical protein [Nonomuraea cavernae]|uniref:Uncharacterized protein n=1 Tax=Nonomuraea cavernae TaxID=2045107 RepID=A0A918DGR2_9ACTN|nr:hypothetical protein [Nonomuraea cavernae]MCA2184307.1 hypothetical protein [Nonomuraea cavernae]GGO64198.1 hypothetical protein GCM10012289_13060 [Nonomuraea cavernae]